MRPVQQDGVAVLRRRRGWLLALLCCCCTLLGRWGGRGRWRHWRLLALCCWLLGLALLQLFLQVRQETSRIEAARIARDESIQQLEKRPGWRRQAA
jgi:hypothetical protein